MVISFKEPIVPSERNSRAEGHPSAVSDDFVQKKVSLIVIDLVVFPFHALVVCMCAVLPTRISLLLLYDPQWDPYNN